MSKDYKKLYEDVVALAKDGLTDGLYLSRSAKDVTEFLFPQLKKSENEKISKKLIQLLQNGGRLPDEEHKQALSWLEKLGKIKLTHYDSAEKEKSDFVSGQFIQCRRSFNEFKEDESYLLEYIGDDTYIGKSDNVLDEEFYITPQQLFTLFTHQHCFSSESKQGNDENNEDCNEISKKIDYSSEIIGFLKNYIKTYKCSAMNSWVNWLESLAQPKQKWSEEDKETLLSVKCVIDSVWHNSGLSDYDEKELQEMWEWLDEIWRRVAYPQPKQDWNEEDKEIIKKIIESLQRYMPTDELSEEQEMIAWLEKQSEQKTIDMIEPKFKVGDWITNGEYTWKVTSIYPLDYILQSPNGDTVDDTISHVDEHFHLWTIQDAKDGDVLNSYRVKATIIFKGWNSDGKHINAYCALQQGILIKQEMLWDRDFEPATKEQRDLLSQKMKEEGYEWDAEKKELRKIEQIEKNPTWGEEDEKTRKAILELVKQSSHILNPMNQKSMISWLEKQGDKVDVLDDFPTEFERQVSHLIASSINKEWEYKKDFVKHTANALLQYAKNELENQSEQKPADKVKPKFEVGDWVRAISSGNVFKILSVNDGLYRVLCYDGVEANYPIIDVDYDLVPWTIEDAKDGDVLALNNEYFLFKEKKNSTTECYISHCFIDSAKTFRENGEFLPIERGNKVCPTTKEQYDLLFSKMKEAGYEWDFEKKELKKIEQSCYHNDGLYYAIDILEKTFGKVEGYQSDDGKMEHQIAIETVNALYHKKSVEWSEEDELYLRKAIECAFGNGYLSVSNWLKSLKDRFQLQPKQEWSEEDEEMFDEVCSSIKYAEKHRITCPEKLAKLQLDWLKSIKDKVQPQPKQEWSEEDEKRINSIISSIKYCSEQYPDKKEYDRDIDWIKSLKSHWKPSEEQIGALNYAYCELFKRGENGEGSNCVHPLMTLIDDLKKL